MQGKIMVLDTETSGFPPKAPPHSLRPWNKCRMLELAWHVYSEDGTLESEASYLIKPTFKTEVPWRARNVHGLCRAELISKGHPIKVVLECFASSLVGVSVIVGHNISFDIKVVLAEIHREKHHKLIEHFPKIATHCTMTSPSSTSSVSSAPSASVETKGRRRTKLAVLYQQLFGTPPNGVMHRAMADVAATARIYFHIRATTLPRV